MLVGRGKEHDTLRQSLLVAGQPAASALLAGNLQKRCMWEELTLAAGAAQLPLLIRGMCCLVLTHSEGLLSHDHAAAVAAGSLNSAGRCSHLATAACCLLHGGVILLQSLQLLDNLVHRPPVCRVLLPASPNDLCDARGPMLRQYGAPSLSHLQRGDKVHNCQLGRA